MTAHHATRRYSADRILVVAGLLALSALAWLAMHHLASPDMRLGILTGQSSMSYTDQMGAAPAGAMPLLLFMAVWIVMMVAMMFPAVAPVIVTFHRWVRAQSRSPLNSLVFVAGYLLVWSAIGIVAYAVLLVLQTWVPTSNTAAIRAGAGLLVLAGAYQLTPLKQVCLRRCRSPLAVITLHANQLMAGRTGPMRVGTAHGLYCLGCCWSLMLVLLLLGMMSLVWMALVAAVIFIEKTLPQGEVFRVAVGVGLIGLGIVLVAAPHAIAILA